MIIMPVDDELQANVVTTENIQEKWRPDENHQFTNRAKRKRD